MLVAAALFFAGQEFGPVDIASNLHVDLTDASLFFFGAFFLFLAFTAFVGWLAYINYRFCIDTDALKIKRGILNKEEVSIPYRQVQDVTIERDLLYQIIGVSRLVILTAGREDVKGEEGESEGILPALDKDLAEKIRDDLLRRANIEKVQSVGR